MKKSVEQYIKEHKHYYYCECIIDKKGMIEDVRPSHTITLERYTGMELETLYKMIPIHESPLHWLVDYTGCVAVWYDGSLRPKSVNEIQLSVLNKLLESNIISSIDFPKRENIINIFE